MKNILGQLILLIPVLFIIIGGIFLLRRSEAGPPEQTYVGFFEADEVSVSSELPGRLLRLELDPGSEVAAGDTLALVEKTVIDIKNAQAESLRQIAAAIDRRLASGWRREELTDLASSMVDMAQRQYEFAEKSYGRVSLMFQDSLVEPQRMDEVRFKYEAARDAVQMAEAFRTLVDQDADPATRDLTRSGIGLASTLSREADFFSDQTVIKAPVSGEIGAILAHAGEIILPGFPFATIIDKSSIKAVLNVREEDLSKFPKGGLVQGRVPGLDYQTLDLEVSYIAPMADFADWVPVNEKDKFDMKTFEIHLRPTVAVGQLRPGMSVNIKTD